MSNADKMVNRDTFIAEEIVEAFYQGMLKREPDYHGFYNYVAFLKQHGVLPLIRGFLGSAEFKRVFSESGILNRGRV